MAVISVGLNKHTTVGISIYPNPSGGIFTIITEQLGKNYYITDYIGKIVAHGLVQQTQTYIDLSNMPNGLYILRIEGEVFKLIKK